MGYYINPPDCSKEEFLLRHGIPVELPKTLTMLFGDKALLPVCLVDNGAFTAAGIAYCPQEAQAFAKPDGRAKQWYLVLRNDLVPYYP